MSRFAAIYRRSITEREHFWAEAAEAILSVLPLDTFVEDFAGRMEIVGE